MRIMQFSIAGLLASLCFSLTTPLSDAHFNVANVTSVVSAGDSGELTTLPEVDWPAVSPNVVGVAGTSLYLDANGNRIPGPSGPSETAWSSSGGGLSSYYGLTRLADSLSDGHPCDSRT